MMMMMDVAEVSSSSSTAPVSATSLSPSASMLSSSVNRKRVSQDSKTVSKIARPGRLYNVNLFLLDLYSILGIEDRFEDHSINFVYRLSKSYETIQRVYNKNIAGGDASSAENEINNDYRTIVKVAKFGVLILSDAESRRVYDNYLSYKNSKVYERIKKALINARDNINAAKQEEQTVQAQLEFTETSDSLAMQLIKYFYAKIETPTQLRPTSLNRILVNWIVHSQNRNNENVTLQVLQRYFEKYGPINGIVLCSRKKGCALIEFASISSVTKALNEQNKIYKVTEINRWTITTETKAKLKSILTKINQLEQQLN
ncbi:Djbp [Trabala vishnou gigantina nucleopolyhedrovirus]|uniref:Djbp n=1 Tax=Trabala vishnou gigantina nucleopolyhedrovirus TaxID=2863583 RepID=UPI0024820A87|nr:Djbp [Trabala vishnou gigantina nucleopolyhedrovirus]QYC92706.1 Djbp [Trabala vishnou gigantina nucleopolyhedrovirus]